MELVILQLPFLTRFRPRWSRWVLRLRMFRSSNGAGQCAGAERAWPSADQDVCLGLLGYLCCSDILALVIILLSKVTRLTKTDENFPRCRFSGMEAPAEAEWSTVGKWRRRPAQPAAVLTGSASPTPFPCI